MDAEECAKQTIEESLRLHGSIDDDDLMRVVARVCGKANSVSLSAAPSASLKPIKLGGRKTSIDFPRTTTVRPSRSMSLDLPRAGVERRTSRPKATKREEQMLFEGLRRQVADANNIPELEDTIGRIEEALDDDALRIPRETARLEGLLKKADARMQKDVNLKE